MSRLPRLSGVDIPEEAHPLFEFAKNMMGFTPNDVHDMARNPAILKGVAAMCGAIYAPGEVSQGLKRLIGNIASIAAGCKYCQIHTAHGAHEQGEEHARILAAWEYETSPLFSEAERAALRIAQAGAMTPNEVTDAQFKDLRRHFTYAQIVEIVAVISMFGFLNRWNSTMDTQLEDTPLIYAKAVGVEPR
jgi:uncharacterized peroxidase-related enzyme